MVLFVCSSGYSKFQTNVHHVYLLLCFRDDRILLKWNLVSKDATKLCDFPENAYPIDLHCFMRNQGGLKRQKVEQILLTSTDGMCQIFLHSIPVG